MKKWKKKRKNISKNKTKIKQKSIEESFNLKEFKNSNTMRTLYSTEGGF